MKKIASVLILVLISIICAPLCNAQESGNKDENIEKIVSNIQNKLDSNTSNDIKGYLDNNGITVSTPNGIGNIKPDGLLKRAFSYFSDSLKAPFIMLGKLIAVSLLCMIIKTMSSDDNSLSDVMDLICIICTVILITDTVKNSFVSIKDSIESINTYMVAYLPVFSGITMAGGNIVGSNGYLAIMLFVCEIMGMVASKVLIPFLSIVLAITVVSCINPKLNFSEVAGSIKKVVTVGLGLVMTVFTGLITIQGITGAAADNVSSKAIKFAASSFIPVIGNSVSEAYSTVKSSLGVIRSTVGGIGIIVLYLIILRPVISLLAVRFVIFLSKCVYDLFGQRSVSQLLKSVNSVLSIAMSILIAYALIFTVATSILMLTAFNLGG